jgi:GntR family transcriptional regulator
MKNKTHNDSPVPLYLQIKEHLRTQINSGVIRAGSRLPSERELAEEFNVSRMTSRQALQELAREGVVHSQIGKGTYVKPPIIDRQMEFLTSYTQDMQQRGLVPSSRVLQAEIQPADADVAEKLNLALGTKVVVLSRIRLADGVPNGIETAHLVYDLCNGILDKHDFNHESLYKVLADDYGIQVAWADEVIEVSLPLRNEARLLEIDAKAPVLRITRISHDKSDKRIEYVTSAFRGDRHRLHIILR